MTAPFVDEFGVETPVIYNNDPTNEIHYHYKVRNYIVGLNLRNFSLDYSWIRTTRDGDNENSLIKIFTASYFYKLWMFTYGTRLEDSNRELYTIDEDENITFRNDERIKGEGFLGAQFAAGNHFVLGMFYNYYLLNELSVGLTFFF
jgi:hypothetical protein